MTGRAWELLAVPLRAARRSGLVWGFSLAALIALTVAFYPAFRDEPELSGIIEGMPDALIDAFGLADFGTPAGFLRGNRSGRIAIEPGGTAHCTWPDEIPFLTLWDRFFFRRLDRRRRFNLRRRRRRESIHDIEFELRWQHVRQGVVNLQGARR